MNREPNTTKAYRAVDKLNVLIDRITPNSHDQRRLVGGISATALTLTGVLIANNLQSDGTSQAEQAAQTRGTFNGDERVTQLVVREDAESGARVRTSPDTGILGMSNMVGELSPGTTIITENGVEVACKEGDVYREDVTGNEIQRYWVGVQAIDLTAVDGESAPDITEFGETLWIANDRLGIETTEGTGEHQLLSEVECQ